MSSEQKELIIRDKKHFSSLLKDFHSIKEKQKFLKSESPSLMFCAAAEKLESKDLFKWRVMVSGKLILLDFFGNYDVVYVNVVSLHS